MGWWRHENKNKYRSDSDGVATAVPNDIKQDSKRVKFCMLLVMTAEHVLQNN